MSGRVESIAVDPTDNTHWLIGAADGGVWETRNNGLTWSAKTDTQPTLAMGAIAFARGSPQTVYAGTGEIVPSIDSYSGQGVLKSTDGSATWQLLGATTFSGKRFAELAVDPGNANTVVAATSGGIYRSTDGGTSWSLRPNGTGRFTSLKVDPTNFNRQYAGPRNVAGFDLAGLYRSTDAGQTWTRLTGVPWASTKVGFMALAIAPTNVNVLYVAIQDMDPADDGRLLGLWRTTNAWASVPTWNQIATAVTDNNGQRWIDFCTACRTNDDCTTSGPPAHCWYDNVLSVDPSDYNALYAGGVLLWRYQVTTGTWTDITNKPAPHGIHVDQHALTWAGGSLITGNDGGVWRTSDRGITWINHNTNLAITQFYYGSLHPTNPSVALGGAQDNGSSKFTGSNVWLQVVGGDGNDSTFASVSYDPNTHWAVSTQYLDVERTRDNGLTFCPASLNITDLQDAPFIATYEKCPTNDEFVIAGTKRLWRTTNFFSASCVPDPRVNGPTWRTPAVAARCAPGDFIRALAFAPSDSTCNTYALGAQNGVLRYTTTDGRACLDLDPNNQVPNRSVSDLAFHPSDPNKIYITLSGFDEGTPGAPGHVFRRDASGAWTNVSPPLNVPHDTVVVDPAAPQNVYVGTDLGLWRSPDCGNNWRQQTGIPNVAVDDLQMNNTTNTIVAFTHGRGAFTRAPFRCVGDCNEDGQVTIDELLVLINIALGSAPLSACPEGDQNCDGQITVDEVIIAQNNASNGCPSGASAAVANTVKSEVPEGVSATLEITSLNATAGVGLPDDVLLSINLWDGEGVPAALQLDILYDPTILAVDPTTACQLDARLITTHNLYASAPQNGRLRLLLVSRSGPKALADGPLLSCALKVGALPASGSGVSIDADTIIVSGVTGNQLPTEVTYGNQ
jgi:photosystem II stability/assembly factor-like uncharacterized protein